MGSPVSSLCFMSCYPATVLLCTTSLCEIYEALVLYKDKWVKINYPNTVTVKPSRTKLQAGQGKFRQSKPDKAPEVWGLANSKHGLLVAVAIPYYRATWLPYCSMFSKLQLAWNWDSTWVPYVAGKKFEYCGWCRLCATLAPYLDWHGGEWVMCTESFWSVMKACRHH